MLYCLLVCAVSKYKSIVIVICVLVLYLSFSSCFIRFSLYLWFIAIWLRCTLVWFSLCFFSVGLVELHGYLGFQFSSNLEKFKYYFFKYFSSFPLLLGLNYKSVRPFVLVPELLKFCSFFQPFFLSAFFILNSFCCCCYKFTDLFFCRI